jgi:hypothetical protein
MKITEKVNLFNKGEAVFDRSDKITVTTQNDGLHCVKWSIRYWHMDAAARYSRNGQTVLCANGKSRITRNRARLVLLPYDIVIDSKGVFYRDNVPIAVDLLYFDVNENHEINVTDKSFIWAREEAYKLLHETKE